MTTMLSRSVNEARRTGIFSMLGVLGFVFGTFSFVYVIANGTTGARVAVQCGADASMLGTFRTQNLRVDEQATVGLDSPLRVTGSVTVRGGDVGQDTLINDQSDPDENTYLRAGTTAGEVHVADAGGQLFLGNPTNDTRTLGPHIFSKNIRVEQNQVHVTGLETGYDVVLNHTTDNTGDVFLLAGRAAGTIFIGYGSAVHNTGGINIGDPANTTNPITINGQLTVTNNGTAAERTTLNGQVNVANSVFNFQGDASGDAYIRGQTGGSRVRIGPSDTADIFMGASGVPTRFLGNATFDLNVGFYGHAAVAQPTVSLASPTLAADIANALGDGAGGLGLLHVTP